MSKQLITVFGATGVQGGSVIKAFLGQPKLAERFALRAITRNASSDKAKALASKGVEVVVADASKPESLHEALKGSYGIFAVTNYWESNSREVEVSQGKAIADACVATGVKHAVFSSLPNVHKLTNGALPHVAHFDGKSDIAEYFDQVKARTGMVFTAFMPGFYMSNFSTMVTSSPQVNDGTPTLTLPWDADKTRVALLDAAADTGKFVAGILAHPNPSELDGHRVQAVSQWTSPAQIVADISSAVGKEVKFNSVPESVFINFLPKNIAEELTENMVLVRDYSYYGPGTEKNQDEHDAVLAPLGFKTNTLVQWAESNQTWAF